LFNFFLSGCGLFVKTIPRSEIPNRTLADKFIDIDGMNIHYQEYPADSPNVFMPQSLTSSMYTWEKVAPILQKIDYHVWLMDMKGFGWSNKPENSKYDIKTHTNEVNTLLLYCQLFGHRPLFFSNFILHIFI